MRHDSAICSFNIFSTNGPAPSGGVISIRRLPELVTGRADHAKMLDYAAKRRLAAQRESDDRAYWKACAPVPLNRATAIRLEAGLAMLP